MTVAPAKGNVIALAGYVKMRDEKILIFSALAQDTNSCTILSIDRIAKAIPNSKK